MIAGIISTIATVVTSIFTKWNERKQAQHDVYMAREEARKQIAMKTIEAELELGQTQVKATGRFFKYFTFMMWFGPFMLTTVYPDYGVTVFKNLELLPEWYVQSCMVIMFAIWGIQVGKDSISHIFSGLGAFFNKRQMLNFQRKVFYDALRSSKGPISQHEVDALEKALNKAIDND